MAALAQKRDHARPYRECMGLALSHLHRRFPALAGDERLEIYDEIWAKLLEREREGFWPERLEPYLIGAVEKQARFHLRTRIQRKTDPSDPLEGAITRAPDGDMEEAVIGALDVENYRAIATSFSELEGAAWKLRFDWGLTPGEIAKCLGVGERRCYKAIARASAKLRVQGEGVRRGEHVRRYEKLIRRHLAGTSSAGEAQELRQLIATSSQAKMIAAEMFRASREVAALLPAPALADQVARPRALEGVLAAKQHLADALTGAKQQASTAYVRASELPQQAGQHLAAVRPGAAAMAIGGCLAIGGGTAACLVEGVNPVRPLYDKLDTGGDRSDENRQQAEDRSAEAPPSTAPQTPTSEPTPSPQASPQSKPAAPQPSAAEPRPNQAAPSPPTSGRDFEFEQDRPATPPAPAPTSSKGGGEFF